METLKLIGTLIGPLTDQQSGQLIKAVCAFLQGNQDASQIEDKAVSVCLEVILKSIGECEEKKMAISAARSKAGKMGGRGNKKRESITGV